MVTNLGVNIVENSYGKPDIMMDEEHFGAIQTYKRENYAMIYANEPGRVILDRVVKYMMEEIYEQLLDDLLNDRRDSPIFLHHIDYVNATHYRRDVPYEQTEPNQIVVDYIASMTDDYLIELYRYLFPESNYYVEYMGYFNDIHEKRTRLQGQIGMED